MYKIILSIFGIVLILTQCAFGQTGSVTGRVTDTETGQPLPGAHIFIPELNRGDVSNRDGNYTILNLPVGSYTLRVSFVGYETTTRPLEISAGISSEINVTLGVAAISLGDLVVTGYAVTPKRELTGAITRVSSREIQDIPLQNVESLLQGRAAGVQIQTTSGNPGGAFRVQIRGQGSINAPSQPLYIIDGVQVSHSQLSGVTSTSPLNSLNPNDIESIEVLKDAASAAIYGSQAASGVVVITTKRGIEGRTRVSASVERGFRNAANVKEYLDTEQALDYLGEAMFMTGRSASVEAGRAFWLNNLLANFGSPTGDDRLSNTKWQEDYIYHTGATEKYSISAIGGDQRTRFYISAGYNHTEAHYIRDRFEQLSLRTNFDHQVTERLSASLNLGLSRTFQFGVCQDGNFVNCPPAQAMFEPPWTFPYLPDGSYNPDTNFGITGHPMVAAYEYDRSAKITAIQGVSNLRYRVNDWLNVTGMVGIDVRRTQDRQYRSPIAAPGQGGWLSFADRDVENITANLVANAARTFDGVHNVSGLAGVEYRRDYSQSVLVRGDGFPGPFFKVLGATARPTTADGVFGEFRVGSYFVNAKYNYAEKYFISLVGRYDGHSRFGDEKRWGFFPSISGAWRISQEDFFNVDFIDELKLRVGYGTTGNANIGNFAARGLYTVDNWVSSYAGQTALSPAQLANAALGWEEAHEINVGLDFAIIQGRISAEIDVYRRDTKELLFDRLLPADSGFEDITENIGTVRNEGIEFAINSINYNTRNVLWSTRFNIGFLRNEITKLPDGETISPNSFTQRLEEGKPIGILWAPEWAGVNPADGRPMWYDINGNLTYTPSQARDAIHWKDGQQNITGGFGNTVSYKGVSLDVFFEFNFGQWGFANTDWYFTRTFDLWANLDPMVNDRWREPGDITYFPKAIVYGPDYVETGDFRTTLGTHSVYNASYIRLKNVTVSYALPRVVTDRLNIAGLRLYVTGINLHTWTAWPFYDPELAFSPTDIFGNITTASYPVARQINGGFEIQF